MPFALTLLSIIICYFSPGDIDPQLAHYHIQQVLVPPAAAATLASWAIRRAGLQSPQWILIIGLWFAVVLSLLVRFRLRDAFENFFTFGLMVCIYYLVSVNAFTLARVGIVCGVVALCGIVISVLSILAYYTGILFDNLVYQSRDASFTMIYRIRGFGILKDPNDFAEFLVVCVAFLGLFWTRSSPVLNFLLVILPGAVMTYAIYLTQSRGALFGVGVIVFVVLAPRFGKLPSVVLVVAILGVMLLAQFGGGREISVHESSAGGRIAAWGVGISQLKSDPLFGVGFGQFLEYNELTAHNSFVLCFGELGLFGYFFWLGMIVTTVMGLGALGRLPCKTEADVRFARYVMVVRAAFYGFLATAWFLSRTYTETLYILLGLAAALIYMQRDQPGVRLTLSRWIPATLAWQLVSIFIVYLTIRMRSF